MHKFLSEILPDDSTSLLEDALFEKSKDDTGRNGEPRRLRPREAFCKPCVL